jgi:hypothetical protein
VCYFGEQTAELDRHGHVMSREGSFKPGQDGAEAGISMTAHPQVGQSFTRENYPGHVEDRFTTLDLNSHISVPLLGSDNALLTNETTALEPGVLDHKYYVRDIGTGTGNPLKLGVALAGPLAWDENWSGGPG